MRHVVFRAIAAFAMASGALSAPSALAEPTTNRITALDAACGARAMLSDGRCVAVRIDHLRRMKLQKPVGKLLIGNPAIADATMISAGEVVITAKSVGTTNMIFIGRSGGVIADFEVLVLEGPQRRVTLRLGPNDMANYQCAPRCERTLSLSDSAKKHSELSGVISRENSMIESASGAQDSASKTTTTTTSAAPTTPAPAPSTLTTSTTPSSLGGQTSGHGY